MTSLSQSVKHHKNISKASGWCAQLRPVSAPVQRLQMLDAAHVVACLGELDPLPLAPPRVDVLLAGVVRGEGVSVNTWIVRALSRSSSSAATSRSGKRLTGYAKS